MARDDRAARLHENVGRGAGGRLASVKSALERFREKCRFDATTGCVIWTGAKTAGRGNTAVYGKFRNEHGESEYAHRYAARAIHGLDIGGLTVGHCCEPTPNTLCVQHLEPQSLAFNVAEGNTRRAVQGADERQHWLFVSLGIYEPVPEAEPAADDLVPYYDPPAWLGIDKPVNLPDDDCPF